MARYLIVIDELELASKLKHKLSESDFFELMDDLHDNYGNVAHSAWVPVEYIRQYSKEHDPVCEGNLMNMVTAWQKECGEEDEC